MIDTTTGDPEQAVAFGEQLAARGVGFIDAAIAGSSEQLRRGEVNVLAGGSDRGYRDSASSLQTFSQKVFHMGPCGSGARMKLVSNLVLGLNRAVLAEGLAFRRAPRRRCVDSARGLEGRFHVVARNGQ